MPQTINNEDIWNKAKDTFVKKYNKQPEVDWEWAYVNKVYQTMGGTFGDMFIPIVKSLEEQCRLREMVGLSDIKSFVRKFIDNPIKSAIVAYLIFKILKSNAESFNEAVGDCKKDYINGIGDIMNYNEKLNKLMEEMNYQKGIRVRTDKASKIAKMIKKESYKEITGYNICPVCKKKYPAKDESKYKKGNEPMCLDCGNKIKKNIESYKEEITIDLSKRSIADIKNILKMLDDESVWYSIFGRKLTVDEDEIRGNFDLAQQKFIYKESLDEDDAADETPQDEIDKITMDVPLLTRILEYFNENKMDDVKLHVILTNIINESKKIYPLNINNYENIIGDDIYEL